MSTNWRISSFNGALLAAYFIPTWTILAYRIMEAPIHSFYERPNVAVAFFASDYLQFAATGMVRTAWLLALARMTVVAFFAIFLALLARPSIRRSGRLRRGARDRARPRQPDLFCHDADGLAMCTSWRPCGCMRPNC